MQNRTAHAASSASRCGIGWNLALEIAEQRPDHVLVVGELLERGVPVAYVLGDQRQSEGVSVRDTLDRAADTLRHAARFEEALGVSATEVAEGDHIQEVAPSEVGAPGRRGCVATCDEHLHRAREPRKELVEEPRLEGLDRLEAVEEDQRRLSRPQRGDQPGVRSVPSANPSSLRKSGGLGVKPSQST